MLFSRLFSPFCISVRSAALLAALAAFGIGFAVQAQLPAGTPDSTFPAASSRITVTSAYNLEASDLLSSPDGSLWLMGKWRDAASTATQHPVVTKLTAAGAVDTSYGDRGSVVLEQSDPCVMAPAAGGQMLAVIRRPLALSVQRLTAQGTQDSTFGNGGEAYLLRNRSVRPGTILIEPDGKIVITAINEATSTLAKSVLIMRLLPDGSLDTTFGAPAYGLGAMELNNTGFVPDQVRALHRKADGTYVLAVSIDQPAQAGVATVHLDSSGRVDFNHGYQGVASNRGAGLGAPVTAINRVVVDDQGLWVLGKTSNLSETLLIRLTTACAVDTTFSGDGNIPVRNDGLATDARDVVQRSDGRLFVVGRTYSTVSSYSSAFVRCYRPDGVPETAFGFNHNIAAGSDFMGLNRVILSSGNRVLVAGARYEGALPLPLPAPASYGVARYVASALQVNAPPEFLATLASQTVEIGSTASLDLRVAPNTLTPWYKWKKNGVSIAAPPSLNPVRLEDEGTYSVEVGNYAGSVTQSFTLSVHAPPIIVAQPRVTDSHENNLIYVEVDGRRPLTIRWERSGSAYGSAHEVPAGTGSYKDYLKVPRSAAYAGDFRCTVTNASGAVTSEVLHYAPWPDYPVVVDQPQPLERLAREGGYEDLSLTVQGRAPLTLQWQKDGVDFGFPRVVGGNAGYAESFFLLESISLLPESSGVYQCRISNASASVTTAPVPVIIHARPVVLMDSPRQILHTGDPFVIGFRSFVQTPLTSVQVLKNNARFASIGVETLSYPATVFSAGKASLSSAGTYQVAMRGEAGRLASDTLKLAVVDNSTQRVVNRTGGTATLSVRTAGADLYLTWRRVDGQPLAGPRFSGLHSHQLKISQLTAADAGDYVCDVVWGTVHGPTVASGVTTLELATERPFLAQTSLPAGAVLVPYIAALNVTGHPARVSISGLPRGLALDPVTLTINGRALVAGTFQVKISCSNAMGASPAITLPLTITPLPSYVTGSYVGQIDVDSAGTFKMTVAGNGAFTAKTSMPDGKGTFKVSTFIGQCTLAQDGTVIGKVVKNLPASNASDSLRGACELWVQWSPAGQYVEARLTSPLVSTDVGLYKRGWEAPANPAAAYAGYSTVALRPALEPSSCGIGYGGLTVKDSGDVTLIGRLPDGTVFTTAGFLSPFLVGGESKAGCYLYTSLYNGLGHLSGPLWGVSAAAADRIEGAMSWRRPESRPVIESQGNVYGGGFWVNVGIEGSLYLPPGRPGITTGYMLNALAPAYLEGGIQYNWRRPGRGFYISGELSLGHVLTTPPYLPGDLFHVPRLTFQPATGFWSGHGTYYAYNEDQTKLIGTLPTTFFGAVVRLNTQAGTASSALGFFTHRSSSKDIIYHPETQKVMKGPRIEGGTIELGLAPK